MTLASLSDLLTRDLDRAINYALLWGLEALELRMIGDGRVPYVNEEKLRRRLVESELEIASIVPGIFEGDVADRATWLNEIAEISDSIAFCKRIGCDTIVVSAFHHENDGDAGADRSSGAVEAFRRMSDAVAKSGIQIAVLNETGSRAPTASRLAELVSAVDRPNVRGAWSPVESLRNGEDPGDGARLLQGLLALVRCSDVKRSKSGSWTRTPLGEGSTGWRPLLEILGADFDGVISFDAFVEPAAKQAIRDTTWLPRAWREVSR